MTENNKDLTPSIKEREAVARLIDAEFASTRTGYACDKARSEEMLALRRVRTWLRFGKIQTTLQCLLVVLIVAGCQSTLSYTGDEDTQTEEETDGSVDTTVDTATDDTTHDNEADAPDETEAETDTVVPDTAIDTAVDDSAEEEPTAECGNGYIDEGETCDDSNTGDCDGCSSLCQIETALTFPGSTVAAQINPAPCITGNATWEFWVKSNHRSLNQKIVFKQQWNVEIRIIASEGTTEYPDGIWWQVHVSSTEAVGGSWPINVGSSFAAGEWHHVALTREQHAPAEYIFHTFLDGHLVNTNTYTTYSAWTCTSDQTLYIVNAPGNSWFDDGLVDDIRFSSAALYTGDFVPSTRLEAGPDTVALWSFDGSLTVDESGNGYDLTVVDGLLWPSDECHTP